jgi:hypothetical protein
MRNRNIGNYLLIAIVFSIIIVLPACSPGQTQSENGTSGLPGQNITSPNTEIPQVSKADMLFIMKGVGIDIPQKDFTEMKDGGIDILTTEWGMEEKPQKAKAFLDKAYNASLKVVMDGGFSYPAWGFTGNDETSLPTGKKPEWQKAKVQQWVEQFKDHPAVYGWDICNEYGENLPSGAFGDNSQWPETKITIDQIKQARADVLEIDPDKPIFIRMNHQYFEPKFGNIEGNFTRGMADVVILNLYSNYMQNNKVIWPTVIQNTAEADLNALRNIDPNTGVWLSLAAFEISGLFQKPSLESLLNDIEQSLQIPGFNGIAFFSWGPSPGDATGRKWYMPNTGSDLWKIIKFSIQDFRKDS